jgi:hypothetical protein
LCHVKGVKDVPRVTPMLELAEKSYLVVSDSDAPAKEQQKKYKPNEWFRYDQLNSAIPILSGEDFVVAEAYKDVLSQIVSENPNLGELPIKDLEGKKAKIEVLTSWLQKSGIVGDNQKQLLDRIKSQIFENLKPSQIEAKYFDALQVLAQKLDSMRTQLGESS